MLDELDATLSSENRYHDAEANPGNDNKQVETSMEPAYKILIADDHPLFREAISSVIASGFAGSEIIETADLDSALEITRENDDLDLILLDLNMPGMHGLTGLITLRNEAPTIPVVIVSADEDKQVAEDGLAMLHARHDLVVVEQLEAAGRACRGLDVGARVREAARAAQQPAVGRRLVRADSLA